MASKLVVVDKDKGYRALLDRIRKCKGRVEVGIFEAEGGADAKKTRDPVTGAIKDSPTETVLDVAIKHEFGLGAPERSFLRAWVDANEKASSTACASLFKRAVKGDISPEKAFYQWGLWSQGQIQKRIAQGIEPANSQITIARKGSSTPLIDTGQLRSSITFRLVGITYTPPPRDTSLTTAIHRARKAGVKALKRSRKQIQRMAKRGLKKGLKVSSKGLKKGLRLSRQATKKAARALRSKTR